MFVTIWLPMLHCLPLAFLEGILMSYCTWKHLENMVGSLHAVRFSRHDIIGISPLASCPRGPHLLQNPVKNNTKCYWFWEYSIIKLSKLTMLIISNHIYLERERESAIYFVIYLI